MVLCGQVVEGGHDREDGGAGVRRELHVAQVDAVEGGLAHAEDEAAALLEADIGGSLDEVRGEAVGDAGERAHGAWQNDHAVGGIAAAGDGGADVGFGVLMDFGVWAGCAEELFDQAVAAAELQFFGEDAQGGFRGDEVDVGDAGVGIEGAQHFGGEDGAAGAGDGKGKAKDEARDRQGGSRE